MQIGMHWLHYKKSSAGDNVLKLNSGNERWIHILFGVSRFKIHKDFINVKKWD